MIIPAYNAGKTIEWCLHFIFEQSYQNFEVIVVNDGSNDSTREKLEKAKRALGDRIRILHQQNRGAPAARNRGAKEAKGEYLIFCDADIVMQEDCLKKMVHALEEHTDASYAYSSFKFGWKKFKLWPFDAARLRRMPYIHTTSLIRAEHFPKTGWDESVKRLQDWDLWLTMLEHGHTGVWIPAVLFTVVNTKGTMSRWMPAFCYKIPKWLGIRLASVTRYNEAVARIKQKHGLS